MAGARGFAEAAHGGGDLEGSNVAFAFVIGCCLDSSLMPACKVADVVWWSGENKLGVVDGRTVLLLLESDSMVDSLGSSLP